MTAEHRPSAAYLQKIVTGARAHGLPEEYIHAIEATAGRGKSFMQIWVDADACPGEIKELLYRAAQRAKVRAIAP